MQGVPSKHPPGGVVFISGELPRYGVSMQCLQSLKVPGGSMLAWQMGVMVTRSLQQAFTAVLSKPEMQWLWLMGDDHTYAPDTLMKLLDTEEPVVAPLVLNRAPPFNTTVHVRDQGTVKYPYEMPARGYYTVKPNESCGDAGLLIRRHVLEELRDQGYQRHVMVDNAMRRLGSLDVSDLLGKISEQMAVPPGRASGQGAIRLLVEQMASLIPPERLAELPKAPPEFAYSFFDHWTSGALSAEDQQFTARLGRAGYPVKIDVGLTMGHVTPMDVQPVLKEDGVYEVRIVAGNQHVCDMRMEAPKPTADVRVLPQRPALVPASEPAVRVAAE